MWVSFHHAYAKVALLHIFVIFIVVSKLIQICYKGTDRFVAETTIPITHPDVTSVAIHNCKNLSK
jgi:hypothetical protein